MQCTFARFSAQWNGTGIDPPPLWAVTDLDAIGPLSAGWVYPEALEIARGALQNRGYPGRLLKSIEAQTIGTRRSLEAAILPALQRSPCVMTFSGGRDSSAVLAVAVRLARTLGLADPLAVTRYFPGVPESDESKWQELVIRELRLDNWERVAFDEMDVVGPNCIPSLLTRGPLWPPLIHTWPPIFELAKGGAILTGEGGDELFDPIRCTIVKWLLADPRRARNPTALREGVEAVAPKVWRRRQARSRMRGVIPDWLLPVAARDYLEELVAWEADEPLSWLESTARLIGDRSHRVGLHNFALLAAEYGILLVHPLLNSAFVLGYAREAGRFGFAGRTAGMRALFGDVLPDEIVSRPDKIYMNQVMLSSSTRAFADSWSGRGVDKDLADLDILRACWRSDNIPVASTLALQAAWFADHSGLRVEDP
jgi:hypothetical protein